MDSDDDEWIISLPETESKAMIGADEHWWGKDYRPYVTHWDTHFMPLVYEQAYSDGCNLFIHDC